MTSTRVISVLELVNFARENSPYLRGYYANLPGDVSELSDLPVLDPPSFWAANTILPLQNQVVTASSTERAMSRTEGTTVVSEASSVSREEFCRGAQSWAACLTRAGLRPGDRVANLLHGRHLYKGFLDLSLALTDAPIPSFHLSIGVAPVENQA